MTSSLEHSNLKIIRMDLWRKAQKLHELAKIVNPCPDSVQQIYESVLNTERKIVEMSDYGKRRK